MTDKLYDLDSYLWSFDATVLSCVPGKAGYLVTLDRTAFFPEGGGQGADHGMLGPANVLDVHEKDDAIVHLTDRPLPEGPVHGVIDDARRMEHMQQHSGEHIFSGLVYRRFGFHNVGFHMGSDAVTMDFDGVLEPAQIADIERAANEAIWKDIPLRVYYPTPEELAHLDYRSKKALTGPVRLVEIPGYDLCACCGTHVTSTGQIGQVKVLGFIHYKGGVRVSILCGRRALDYTCKLFHDYHGSAQQLSAKEGTLSDTTARLLSERDALKNQCRALALSLFRLHAEKETDPLLRIVSVPDIDLSLLRPCAGELASQCTAALVVLPRDHACSFALSSLCLDVRPLARALTDAFHGRGGGAPDMVQGILELTDTDALRRVLLPLLSRKE